MQIDRNARLQHEYGGAALEYVLVSTFAAAICTAALSFIGQAVQTKLEHLADKLGSDAVPEDLEWIKNDSRG